MKNEKKSQQVETEVSAEALAKALKVKSRVRAGILKPPILAPGGDCPGCGRA